VAYFLLKTEPATYSWDQLAREGKAVWDGVSNPVALRHIRTAQPGDLVVIYHTGDERAAVGVAEVTSPAYPDPKDGSGKLSVFDLAPRKKLTEPITLQAIKSMKEFSDSPLLRQGRLSVVPLDATQWTALLKAARTTV
jgi:predicted RNA-binding protein with PUA-like domain